MMLISHLPWSFLLAKAVALSVQERIEGWIVDFFIDWFREPGFFPRSAGAIYNLGGLFFFFVIPQLYLLAPKKNPNRSDIQVFEVIC